MVALSRPALISPFSYTQLKQWRAFDRWKRSDLLSTYGDLTLQVRRDQFNNSARLSPMTMRAFVASWEEPSMRTDDIQRPGYVRDATPATYRLLRDLEWGEKQYTSSHDGTTSNEEVNESCLVVGMLCATDTGASPSQWVAGIPFFNTSRLRAHSFEFNLGPPRSGSNMRFCGHQIDVVTYTITLQWLHPSLF